MAFHQPAYLLQIRPSDPVRRQLTGPESPGLLIAATLPDRDPAQALPRNPVPCLVPVTDYTLPFLRSPAPGPVQVPDYAPPFLWSPARALKMISAFHEAAEQSSSFTASTSGDGASISSGVPGWRQGRAGRWCYSPWHIT
jgi:hypothetical protein